MGKLGTVLLCLFALPFASFGVFALLTAIRQMLTGTSPTQAWLGLAFGLVFTGIGFGLMLLVIFGSSAASKLRRRQAEHPAEPWLWRDDWAQGRIKGGIRGGMVGGWIFAVFWNLISLPVLVAVLRQAPQKPLAYLGLIFPLVGFFLLVRAIRCTIAFFEFGTTWFEMSPVPGVIGGALRGTIQARFPHSPEHGVQLRVSCVNRVTSGSGNSESTSEKILWRDEASLSSWQLYPGPIGTSIPVSFRIPWDAQASDTSKPRDAIVWKLEALADVPGVNYQDSFEVPVFRTQETPAQPPADELAAEEALPVEAPASRTVQIRPTESGVEFYFPAARNKGMALGTTIFLMIFGAITFFLVRFHVLFIFPLAFGFFALLLFYISVRLWLGTTRDTIGNGVLRVQDGWLGSGSVRSYRCTELSSIGSRIMSQQGGSNGTPYYDIEANLRNGKRVTLGRTLRSKQETDWLCDQMRQLTGLQAKAMTAETSR